MKISVIVPCFNEEKVIEEFYTRTTNAVQSITPDYELLFINDGSKDTSKDILLRLSNTDSHVIVFSFTRNFGHQAAVSCGIHNCTGDVAIIIDADLQDPPEVLPDMVKLYEDTQTPIVYGKRAIREGESFFKKITAKFFYRIINALSDVPFPVDTGDFRLINRAVVDTYNRFGENPKYIRGLISWTGFKQTPFEYVRKARFAGETKYTLKKMLKLAKTGILSFSTKPLGIALVFSVISFIIAIGLTCYVLYQHFFTSEKLVPGWASLIIAISFFSGIQLLVLAIISEYLGNIFTESKKRPEYIIDSVFDSPRDSAQNR